MIDLSKWAHRAAVLIYVVAFACFSTGLELACSPARSAADAATLDAYAYNAAALAMIALDQAVAAHLDAHGMKGRELTAESAVAELRESRDHLNVVRGALQAGHPMPWLELGKATEALTVAVEHARSLGVDVPQNVPEGVDLAARAVKVAGGS